MKTAGIIAEYNPFHDGHKYHIEETKKQTGADYCVVAMSGNFVQRGAPAIIDKYARAKSALAEGADLVIQIPPVFSLSSAEFYAKGSIALLENTGLIDYLSFGSEAGNLEKLEKLAHILADEPDKYKKLLQKYLKAGNAFPAARAKALIDYCPDMTDLSELVSSPNNILAIEYLKALISSKSEIKPVTMKRVGAGYNDPYAPGQPGISAKAIREAISYGSEVDNLKAYMPKESFKALKDAVKKNMTVDENDFSEMLIYKLLSEREHGYTKYLDVSEELSDRIGNNLEKFKNITDFCNLLKTKDKTYTRVSRALFHILLDITQDSIEPYDYTGSCPYIRVLGFRKSSEAILSEIKTKASVPVLCGYNDAADSLYSEPMKVFRNESKIEDLYFAVQTMKSGVIAKPDLSRPIVVV
ncbi:MAG: nucleotidyltransferase [Lachnospiraceae bacterium]|nr:nucleotidyltransferase [Lachnospiraceae bacterium]